MLRIRSRLRIQRRSRYTLPSTSSPQKATSSSTTTPEKSHGPPPPPTTTSAPLTLPVLSAKYSALFHSMFKCLMPFIPGGYIFLSHPPPTSPRLCPPLLLGLLGSAALPANKQPLSASTKVRTAFQTIFNIR
jgi:hypothetical protein